MRARGGQVAEAVEDEAANRVDAIRFDFEAKVLAQVVESGIAADQESSILQRLNIKLHLSARNCVAQNFLDDIRGRNDSFGPAEFIHDDGESLGMREEEFQQVERSHRLRYEGGRNQRLRVVHGGIDQKVLHIQDPDQLIGRVHVNRNAPMPLLTHAFDRLLVR